MAFVRIHVLLLLVMMAAVDVRAQQVVNAYPNLSFTQPVFLTNSNDGTDRMFVVQQTGIIKVFPNDSLTVSADTFLDVSSMLSSSSGEQGLLGLVFHPNYAVNGYFYVNYTAPSPLRTVVSRFKVLAGDPNRADPLSEFKIIEIPQPFPNHKGGMLLFGSDGYLYIGMGDGGSAGDPQNNAQDRTKLLGKILRIDVNDTTAATHYIIPPDNPYVNDVSGFRKEIWAYGFRNPWRFSFDSVGGDLWVGDVGQDVAEEIDIVREGKNYGWRIMEGTFCYNPPTGCDTVGLTPPIKEYLHPTGDAIIGGHVYRGYRRPDLVGAYIYGDYITGKIWVLRYQSGTVTVDSFLLQMPSIITSFGVDQNRELYIVGYSASGGASIYRFSGSRLPETPRTSSLRQNYPNPFAAVTRIDYELKKAETVSLRIYDVAGRPVRVLLHAKRPAGKFWETWDGIDAAGNRVTSGVYLYRLEAGTFAETRKMILLK